MNMKTVTGVAIVGVIGVVLTLAGPAQASMAYDGFDYATGALTGQNGGTGWSAAWVAGTSPGGTASVITGNLSFPNGTDGPGNMLGTRAFNSTRTLPSDLQVNYNTAGTYYLSVLVQKNAASGTISSSENIGFVPLSGNNSQATNIAIGSSNAFSLNNSIGSVSTANNAATSGTTYFLVLKMITRATGIDDFFMKAFAPGDSFSLEPASWTLSKTSLDLSATTTVYTALSVQAGNGASNNADVDEVRMGHNYADILPVPEPATLGLLGLGGLGLLRRR